MEKNKCIFLDRDGTINVYKGLISRPEDLELEKNAAEAIKMINESEYLCIVVSNQPVVAKNLCSLEELWRINDRLRKLLEEKGAYLDDIFVCPHHPDKGYPGENTEFKIRCNCRKPDIGMIEMARQKYNIDLSKSYIIGDSTIDIQTGINCNMKTILVKTGLGGSDKIYRVCPDYIANNLYEAVNLILGDKPKWNY
ncbi:D-glycero-alpha-D-manno-heptose-1,7-bisphosphate 7-phosphatase [Caldicellulosiruptor acetigenus]|uniref:D-glycero-alpha-D-manno-heptose-1,7-bisphosphate 7-phosphatase n=1 Tax=Caldicellulosiruptor acetigenus TaxID=301953 RepID=UPI00042A46FE|nr:HAD family hydrolase [Caldicellulosiruptor acetigenus]WAM37242.1 HAD family hydrolase [Caldicellulosiruptor acetigenus]